MQFYQSRRVFYNLVAPGTLTLGQQSWSQPTKISELLVGTADDGDPSQAVVALHSVACVRELVEPAEFAIQPGVDLAGPSRQPPISNTFATAPTANLPCDELTVGRGIASPQYKITFRDATRDDVVVYVDGGNVLSLPASQVTIALLTPETDFVLAPNANTPPVTTNGLYVDAEASANVSWGSRNGSSGAMGGMATFTQTQLVQDDGNPAAPVPGVMLFERPPFARDLSIIPAPSLVDVASFFYTVEYMSGATVVMGLFQSSFTIAGNIQPARAIVPGPVTHVRITPITGYTVGAPIHCVWGIGVR